MYRKALLISLIKTRKTSVLACVKVNLNIFCLNKEIFFSSNISSFIILSSPIYFVCRWTCTRVCTRMFTRIIVQTFVSSSNENVTKTRQDISQIRGTSTFLRTEAKGLPPGLFHRFCGCWGLSFSTTLWAAVAVLSRWWLSITICARMFYDTFVFNFGFYCLWWCIYYHWCLYV